MSNLHNALNDLIATLLQLYLYVFLLRIILQWVRADFYNPVSQLISRVTHPLIKPLQGFLPRWPRFDLAAALVLLVLMCIYIQVMALLWGQRVGVLEVAGLALVKLVILVLNLYIFSLVVQAILSWVGPGFSNPAGNLLWVMNEPLLKPVRRVIPPASGLDFSPMVVILLLIFVRRLILLPPYY